MNKLIEIKRVSEGDPLDCPLSSWMLCHIHEQKGLKKWSILCSTCYKGADNGPVKELIKLVKEFKCSGNKIQTGLQNNKKINHSNARNPKR